MKLIELWNCDIEKAYDLFSSFEECEHGFENIAYGMTRDEFRALVEMKRRNSLGLDLLPGYVPDTVYILVSDEGEYVGIFNFRHHLNDFLATGPGHIGYGIAPGYRGRGYAKKGLSLLVPIAFKVIPEDELYLSADHDNTASIRTQLSSGAVIVRETETKYYTRIRRG